MWDEIYNDGKNMRSGAGTSCLPVLLAFGEPPSFLMEFQQKGNRVAGRDVRFVLGEPCSRNRSPPCDVNLFSVGQHTLGGCPNDPAYGHDYPSFPLFIILSHAVVLL